MFYNASDAFRDFQNEVGRDLMDQCEVCGADYIDVCFVCERRKEKAVRDANKNIIEQ